jgi:hypothetical protein
MGLEDATPAYANKVRERLKRAKAVPQPQLANAEVVGLRVAPEQA